MKILLRKQRSVRTFKTIYEAAFSGVKSRFFYHFANRQMNFCRLAHQHNFLRQIRRAVSEEQQSCALIKNF